MLLKSTQAEESLSIRLTATELLVESHGVLGVTSLKDVAAIVVGNIHIHRTFLLEAKNLMRQCLSLMSTTVSSLCCNCWENSAWRTLTTLRRNCATTNQFPRLHQIMARPPLQSLTTRMPYDHLCRALKSQGRYQRAGNDLDCLTLITDNKVPGLAF